MLFLWSNIATGEQIRKDVLRLPMKFTDRGGLAPNINVMPDETLKEFYRVRQIYNLSETREKINKIQRARLLLALGPDSSYVAAISKEEALRYFDAGLLIGAYDGNYFTLVCPDIEIANKLKQAFIPYGPDLYNVFKELADKKIEANKKLARQSKQELITKRLEGVNVTLPIIDPRIILEDFNKANKTKEYTLDQVVKSAKIQLAIMKWLKKELGLNYIYPAMDLTRFGGLVAFANNKGNVVREAEALDGTKSPKVDAFIGPEELNDIKLEIPDPAIYPPAKLPIEFIEQANSDPELDDASILVFIEGPYTLLGNIMGLDAGLQGAEGLCLLPGTAEGITRLKNGLNYTKEVIKRNIDDLDKADTKGLLKAICFLEPSASAGERFLRPENFEEFVLPVIDEIAAYAKKKGIKVAYHSCGNTTKNFDAFAKFKNVDIISADKVNPGELLAKLPEHMAVVWGSDAKKISNLEPEEIFEDMKGKTASGIDKGRWCPGTNCQVKSKITLTQLQAFVLGSTPNLPPDITLDALLNRSLSRTQM